MKKLQITSRDGKPTHYHVLFLNDDDQVGATSLTNAHQHQVVYDPPRPPREATEAVPPQIDPMTGMPAIDPNTGQPDQGQPADPGDPGKEEGSWVIAPAEDGHTHELKEYRIKVKETKELDQDIINDILSLWRTGIENEKESLEMGKESEKFRRGKQWTDEQKRYLEGLNRASLTINEIGNHIDELIGYQIEERTDFKFLPREGSDQRAADITNQVFKYVLDECYYQREETKVFEDQIVPGRGVFNIYMDFQRDIEGDVKVEKFQWDQITYGPHEKEDLTDCEYQIKDRMYSLPKLTSWYGAKAGKIEQSFKDYSSPKIDSDKDSLAGTNTDYKYAERLIGPLSVGNLPMVDIAKKEFRLVECWRKEYEPTTVIYNDDQDFSFTAFGWEDKDIISAKTIPGFSSITQNKTRLRVTKFCGSVVLSDENPADLPLQDFYTVPVYGYRQRGVFWGKVEIAKDPQKEINKKRSLTIDILNRATNFLRYYDEETFPTRKEYEAFKKGSTQPGALMKVSDSNKVPVREDASPFPTGLVEMMQQDQENLSRLMNVVMQPGGANESSSLFMERQKDKMRGNEFLFSNFTFARQNLAKKVLSLIQRYYDVDRLERILNSANSKQPFTVGGVQFDEFSKEDLRQTLENLDLLQMDLITSESAFSPSMRMAVSGMLKEMIQGGAQVPPELVWYFLDIPQDVKDVMTQSMQQQQEAEATTQTNKDNSEVTKTLLAKGQYTVSPQKAGELGLVPAPVSEDNPVALPAVSDTEANNQDAQHASQLASSLAG